MVTLQERRSFIKSKLTSQDILYFPFLSEGGKQFLAVFVDGILDKALLGELVVKPLHACQKGASLAVVRGILASPEVKEETDEAVAISEILEGNAVLFVEGETAYFIIGLKNPPARAVTEPPTQITVKGPREGFTEDIKTNLALVRKRLKTPLLHIESFKVGKQSKTDVSFVYLKDICRPTIVDELKEQLNKYEIDNVADSSYIAKFLAKKPRSLFKQSGKSEKPDIFCAKLCEGRVGILVDGSPIALTVPYMLLEEVQTADDYYQNRYRAILLRLIRVSALMAGVLLPAFYIAAQLFKIQLIPYALYTKIASSVAGIPLSPSIEMFITLFVLEALCEASIRMPKYVGLALSVVGALVLGDTAVKAGIISTPSIIIVAFSAIGLYTVPDFVETSTLLRWLFLLVAGSVGTFGIVLFAAYLLAYLVSEQSYGVPLLSPFAPLCPKDMQDSLYKADLLSLQKRPNVLSKSNQRRLKIKGEPHA
jgi:spore germination protein KA